MRREGFELTVSRPKVLFRMIDGQRHEPMEEIIIDVDADYASPVIDTLNQRKAEMVDMRNAGSGKTRLVFLAPSRGLIGYQGRFLTETRGTGVLNRVFHSYASYKGDISGRRNGALVSIETGHVVAYALFNLQDRGVMFVFPQDKVYDGRVVGEHYRDNDLGAIVLRGNTITTVRASGTG